ncbi:MAG TPA: hemolysin secretion protein D, partial [Nitrospirota bacterium]
MKKRLMIAAAILLVAVVVGILIRRAGNGRDKDVLSLSGNVEVTEVDVAFKIPGRVLTLFTD